MSNMVLRTIKRAQQHPDSAKAPNSRGQLKTHYMARVFGQSLLILSSILPQPQVVASHKHSIQPCSEAAASTDGHHGQG